MARSSRPLRVLLVANTLPPHDLSGVGEQVLQLAAGLRARGHEVEVLGRGGAGARGPKVLFPFTIVLPALRRIREFRPDVVQLHESDGGLLALWLGLRKVRPLLVALLQVSYVEERRAVRPLRHGAEILGLPEATEIRFRRFKAPLHIFLGRRTARAADLVLAPSATTAAELARDYGAHDTAVLPNASGGLPAEPRAVPEVAPDGEPGLLFVGRLRLRKGVEVLLRALALLRAQPADAAAPRLRIVGDGEHLQAIERAAVRFGVRDQVDFLGRRGPAEIRWLLERSAALVVPSIYEGMPLVVLEAMVAGVPVVASRVSGIPEVVLDPETGWLVPPEDPVALARALGELLGDPQGARARGERGRQRLEERYRPEVIAEGWESIVGAALAGRRGSVNRFAKIMQWLGWAGVALLSVVWAQGFLVRDDTPELARHSMIALAAACLCILPRFWTIAYLALAARGEEGARRRGGGACRSPAAPGAGGVDPRRRRAGRFVRSGRRHPGEPRQPAAARRRRVRRDRPADRGPLARAPRPARRRGGDGGDGRECRGGRPLRRPAESARGGAPEPPADRPCCYTAGRSSRSVSPGRTA